jgi:predicted DNA-binding transcriptional regulator YafY
VLKSRERLGDEDGMAKKRAASSKALKPAPPAERPAVTAERFVRLHRLLHFLAAGPQTRARITRQFKLDVRAFYRELELLRGSGIDVTLAEGRYRLADDVDEAAARLPFPDPHLNLGEATQLARGRSTAQRKLSAFLHNLLV